MTNKLGSANPNRIPKKFDLKAKKQDPQVTLPHLDNLDTPQGMAIIKALFLENTKSRSTALRGNPNYWIQTHYGIQDNIDKLEKIWNDCNNIDTTLREPSINAKNEKRKKEVLANIENQKKLHKKLARDFRTIVYALIDESDGEVDRYGMPKAIGFSDDWDKIQLDPRDMGAVQLLLETHILASKDYKGIPIQSYSEQDKVKYCQKMADFIMPKVEEMIDFAGQYYGNEFQKVIKTMSMLIGESVVKGYSAKKGKKYNKDRDKMIAEDLMCYWDFKVNDITMPNNHTRESLFYEIAKKYGLSFDRIKQIESELSKEYKPKPLGIDEDYPNQ